MGKKKAEEKDWYEKINEAMLQLEILLPGETSMLSLSASPSFTGASASHGPVKDHESLSLNSSGGPSVNACWRKH